MVTKQILHSMGGLREGVSYETITNYLTKGFAFVSLFGQFYDAVYFCASRA